MSTSLLGFQLDAIYHTSIRPNGMEYVYDGDVVAIVPGSSHLGQPLQELHLGQTQRKQPCSCRGSLKYKYFVVVY